MEDRTRMELMKIRSMASLLIEKIDKLIPEGEPKKKRSRLSEKQKAEILSHRRLIRYGQHCK